MSIGATFWSFAGMGPYVAAVPFTQNGAATGPYLWSNQGASNQFIRPTGSPGCRVGAVVAQFLFLADLYQQQQATIATGNGSATSLSGTVPAPMQSTGAILDQQGSLAGNFSGGVITGPSGILTSGTVNYVSGAIALTFSSAPANGDVIYAQYIQAAPYRCMWSAIGDPTNWPTPLTNAALAVQSGQNDLDPQLGPVMFVGGYPVYGIVFQRTGITKAQYIGGPVVFSWQPYEFKRGCIAHGAAIKVGPLVYFLADDGLWMTDGASVMPVGTATDNSQGLDKFFYSQVNQSALETIRLGYDSTLRCFFLAFPTGSNTLPDTLLTFNPLANRWTRATIPVETLWTADNGKDATPATRQLLGIINQAGVPQNLTGSPLTGYCESIDVYFNDGLRREVPMARPIVSSADQPLVTVGSRNSLQDSVAYSVSATPDPFVRKAPILNSDGTLPSGLYTRVRVGSTSATNLQGATLETASVGSV